MNKGPINLQDIFLNQARKEKILVTIFRTNGFQFKGTVRGFDNFVVVMDCEVKQQLVYKNAISTIIPSRAIGLMQDTEEE